MDTAKKNLELKNYLERTKRNQFWTKGVDGQLLLKTLKVGVAGLGGMGSNIAEILVRLGVGHLRLADPDIIEMSNLNRQVIANLETLGKSKLEASIEELLKIEPQLDIQRFPDGIQEDNAEIFVKGLDIVINEIDVLHIDKQIHLLEAARRAQIPVYTTLVVGVGIRLYKYSPTSSFTPHDFLGSLLEDPSLENLMDVLGQPVPSYLQSENLKDFKQEIMTNGGIPIFGASTYMGQSLLVIRALADHGCLRCPEGTPKTPCLPEFLVLDPLTLELKTSVIETNGKNRFKT